MGVHKIFSDPQEIWDLYLKYKQDILDNPIIEIKWVGKEAIEKEVKHYKPPTWQGFEAFLYREGIASDLDKYKSNFEGSYGDFVGIIRAIRQDMFDRKFSGAAVGIYQHNIIARELGLADKQEVSAEFKRPILENGKELPGDDEQPIDDLLK